MRAAPAIQISLTRFGAWRAAVLAPTLVAMLTATGWLAGQAGLTLATKVPLILLVAGSMLWLGASLIRLPTVQLAWDGQGWALRRAAPIGIEPVAGALSVAIDLGSWMLLRFVPAAPALRSGRTIWLPVQRVGIEAQWHALRCAVYSPHPVDAASATPRR